MHLLRAVVIQKVEDPRVEGQTNHDGDEAGKHEQEEPVAPADHLLLVDTPKLSLHVHVRGKVPPVVVILVILRGQVFTINIVVIVVCTLRCYSSNAESVIVSYIY